MFVAGKHLDFGWKRRLTKINRRGSLRICLAGLIYGRLSMRRGSKYGALEPQSR